jgi:starch-binding outer membrane protein, SusD/RagB family
MYYLKTSIVILLILLMQSCLKGLDKKPSTLQVTTESVADLQRLMDNQQYINASKPVLGELGCDDYYTTTDEWKGFDLIGKFGYIWDADPFRGAEVSDWQSPYTTILYSNVVLEKINEWESHEETPAGQFVRGQAHFHRAFNYWSLAQIFCKPYDRSSAANDPGLPLRLSSNPNLQVARATVQQTYDHIILDLLNAIKLLPVTTTPLTRPSRVAANALLARVYLSMGDVNNAYYYANQSMFQYSTLIDYSTVHNTSVPFKQFNQETIFFATMGGSYVFNNSSRSPVDSTLYDSYSENDLRKSLFFDTGVNSEKTFKGSYSGNATFARFCGLTTAEMFLVRAECYAWKDSITQAMDDINTLLKKRWNANVPFKPYMAVNKQQALEIIWEERRKELVFRGMRWSDIRRLNIIGKNITLTRYIDGKWYTLPARDPKFVYPIPIQEFEKNPIRQNDR